MSSYLNRIGKKSRKAFEQNLQINTKIKNLALNNYNKNLLKEKYLIIKENNKDILKAKKKKLRENLIDRLIINNHRLDQIRFSVNEIIKQKDPIGNVISEWKRPNGLKIKKVSIPIGVIGIIYESRPNVTSDVAALCFKSGNSAILRGGSEAWYSNYLLSKIFRKSLKKFKINKNCIQFIEKRDKKLVNYFLSKMTNYIDVIIPRGGKNLVKKVQNFSKVPTIGHLEGVCHVYIDRESNFNIAKKIIINSKMRKTSTCGAAETLLIDKKFPTTNLNSILKDLESSGCKIICDNYIAKLYKGKKYYAKDSDWGKEYLAPIISVKGVSGVNEAIFHINKYGTSHTDSIVTNNKSKASIFLSRVNSAIAIHNSSTQFADGGEFGFGAEVGISTNRLHARGPVGLEQLTTFKYIIFGKGQIRN